MLALSALLAGCGGSKHTTTQGKTTPAPRPRPRSAQPTISLRAKVAWHLPSARSGAAAAGFDGDLVVIGGLAAAGASTSTVFTINPAGHAQTTEPLPGPVHDAAATVVEQKLLLFGGGQFEGSDRIIQVAPGQPRQIGTLPQPLSDVEAVTLGDRAYVIGGWNGSATNPDVYSVDPHGHVRTAGRLPRGLRYAAVGTLAGRILVAGGELASGAPSPAAYAFAPSTGRTTELPSLPAATDHAAGLASNGTFYVIAGVRDGSLTDRIIAWRPGQSRWRTAGRLPHALADATATEFDGAIALAGGRTTSGKTATVSLLSARSR